MEKDLKRLGVRSHHNQLSNAAIQALGGCNHRSTTAVSIKLMM